MGNKEREVELGRWDWKPKWLLIKSRVAMWSSRMNLVKAHMFVAEINLTVQMFCPFQAAWFLD